MDRLLARVSAAVKDQLALSPMPRGALAGPAAGGSGRVAVEEEEEGPAGWHVPVLPAGAVVLSSSPLAYYVDG